MDYKLRLATIIIVSLCQISFYLYIVMNIKDPIVFCTFGVVSLLLYVILGDEK